MTKSKKHVCVLMGGWSPEREVSLVSGRDCSKALRSCGYKVTDIDVDRDVAAKLADVKPDIVFNALHGQWGEDGCVQGMLEILGLPYTHSGVLASSLAMDKERAKVAFAQEGIPVAKSEIVSLEAAARDHAMEPPYVIKPNAQGSSVGVFLVREGDNRPPEALTSAQWSLGDTVMVEKFVPGLELTVAVMGDRPLAVTEISANAAFYDYEAKYEEGGSDHQIPAQIPKSVYDQALEMALIAHKTLGCRGVTRSDFRYDNTESNEGLVILELNTQPGMTPTSLVPEQAAHIGMTFEDLVEWIAEDASCSR